MNANTDNLRINLILEDTRTKRSVNVIGNFEVFRALLAGKLERSEDEKSLFAIQNDDEQHNNKPRVTA